MNKKVDRQRKIQDLLLEKNSYSVHQLCEILNCSEATLRNDLRELERKELVQRKYGGVKAATNFCGSHQDELKVHRVEKNSIARYVVDNILKDKQTIVLDVGTTTLALAQYIARSSLKLNVVTNSLSVANVLSSNKDLILLMPGGEYDSFLDTFDTVGTLDFYVNIYADYYFMSCNGVHPEAGITVPYQKMIPLKKMIMKHARKTILLADSSKVNKIAFKKVCRMEDIDMLIVDGNCPKDVRTAFEEMELEIKYADVLNDDNQC